MDNEDIILTESDTKSSVLYDSTYIKYLQESDPQKQKANHWFSSVRRKQYGVTADALI